MKIGACAGPDTQSALGCASAPLSPDPWRALRAEGPPRCAHARRASRRSPRSPRQHNLRTTNTSPVAASDCSCLCMSGTRQPKRGSRPGHSSVRTGAPGMSMRLIGILLALFVRGVPAGCSRKRAFGCGWVNCGAYGGFYPGCIANGCCNWSGPLSAPKPSPSPSPPPSPPSPPPPSSSSSRPAIAAKHRWLASAAASKKMILHASHLPEAQP